jgi:hypothetical protein
MKSAIALGASVLVLMLGGGTQATASGPADLGQTTTVETGVGTQTKAQLGDVQAKANLDADQRTKSRSGTVRQQSEADGSLEVTTHANGTRPVNDEGSNLAGGSGKLTRIDSHIETTASADLRSHVSRKSTGASAYAGTKAGRRISSRHAHASSRARSGATARLAGPHDGAQKPRNHGPIGFGPWSNDGSGSLPLHGIGHEVSNPLRFPLAAWLMLLGTGAGVLRLAARGRLD